jgi:hypothetical protein
MFRNNGMRTNANQPWPLLSCGELLASLLLGDSNQLTESGAHTVKLGRQQKAHFTSICTVQKVRYENIQIITNEFRQQMCIKSYLLTHSMEQSPS